MKILFSSVLLVSLPHFSFARLGGSEGTGGGQGVVCRDPQGQLQSIELLDLWEARTLYDRRPASRGGDVASLVSSALETVAKSLQTDSWSFKGEGKDVQGREAANFILKKIASRFLAENPDPAKLRRLHGIRLTPIEDALDSASPANCAIEQIVRYEDSGMMTGRVLINQDLYRALTPMGQAALIVHEVLYKSFRDFYGEKNSIRVRRIVGLAFSGYQFSGLNREFFPEEFYSCNSVSERKYWGDVNAEPKSTAYLFPVRSGDSSDGKMKVAVQLAMLAELTVADAIPWKDDSVKIPISQIFSVPNFYDLSELKGKRFELTTLGSVQTELHALAEIEDVSPGKLTFSIVAPPSLFQPRGVVSHKVFCELVTK